MAKARRFALWVALGSGIMAVLIGIGLPLLPLQGGRAQDDAPPPPLIELNEDLIKRATVFIIQTYQEGNQTIVSCVGSGTLVSADGLILTNAHVGVPSDACRSDTIVIAITVRLDEPPVPTYTAEVLESSKGLDLAALRISGYLDGRAIERNTLQLPFVELGDSQNVQLDDTITIVGYPDFGKLEQDEDVTNQPVTARRGTVRGFTAEARVGDRAWIRTEAEIPGTMSGGGAYDRDGRLIGIPTIAPARVGDSTIDCRIIQDTNQDGRADRNDSCVPVGGFISAVRPSRLARSLVRAAALGIRTGETWVSPGLADVEQAEGEPTFSRPFFTTSIKVGVPANVVGGGVPAGTTSLYLVFDYDNMVDGMVYELRVTVDNVPDPIYSLPPVTWSGGKRGTWYIGSANTPWRPGLYYFRLFIEGRETDASQSILIGGGARTDPSFSDIVFGLESAEGGLAGTNYVLPEGSVVQARFNYLNMQPGVQWTQVWYKDGLQLGQITEAWPEERGTQGTHVITASTADGSLLTSGQYRLDLYIDGLLSATADFVVAGGAQVNRAVIFTDFQFASQARGGAPIAETIRTDFPAGIESLYAFFDWRLISPGTMWTRRWLVDNEVLFEATEPWQAPPDGEGYYVSLASLDTLPDATYRFEIVLANITVAAVEAKVGLGQLPVEAFASAEGAQITGRITDAETGLGIPGAMFIVLKPEFSVEDFLWDQEQVLGTSLADSGGYFQVPVLLARGAEDEQLLYSVLVRAEGYMPLDADGIAVTQFTESPIDISVELTPN